MVLQKDHERNAEYLVGLQVARNNVHKRRDHINGKTFVTAVAVYFQDFVRRIRKHAI